MPLSRPQHDHADLGLASPIGDNTEDLRPKVNAPGRCWNTAEGQSRNHQMNDEKGNTIMAHPVETHAVSDTDLRLDRAGNLLELARDDIEDTLAQMPDDAPMWVVVDLTAARAHILAAAKKLDTAATRINEAATR